MGPPEGEFLNPARGPSVFSSRGFPADLDLPRQHDWATLGVMTPVRDQRPCQACVSFSFGALIEVAHKRDTGQEVEIAAGWIHRCVAKAACNMVVEMKAVKDRLAGMKVPLNRPGLMPCPVEACPTAPPVVSVPQFKTFSGEGEIRYVLATHGPVVAGMRADISFWSWKTWDVFRPQPGAKRFQHAICLTGYDADEKCWIAKNSYGVDGSGRNGYVRLAWGDCEVGKFDAYRLA